MNKAIELLVIIMASIILFDSNNTSAKQMNTSNNHQKKYIEGDILDCLNVEEEVIKDKGCVVYRKLLKIDEANKTYLIAYIDAKTNQKIAPTVITQSLFIPDNGIYIEESREGKDIMRRQMHYKNGKLDGVYREWLNGKKYSSTEFERGKLNGRTIKWNKNGQKVLEESYKNDKQEGPSTMWFDNGQKFIEKYFIDGKLNEKSTTWSKDGLIRIDTYYKDNKMEGLAITYKDGKLFSQENYRNDKKEGLSVKYYENGHKAEEVFYHKGRRNGVRQLWHQNGQKAQEEFYIDDLLVGYIQAWYETGEKLAKGKAIYGRIVEMEGYYKNGQLRWKDTYKKGLLDGDVVELNEEGKIMRLVE